MPKAKRKSFWRKFLSNLGDPVIKILIGALIINVIFLARNSNFVECMGIAVSILLASFISTMSEHGSQTAFERLEESCTAVKCRVIREGEVCEIDSKEIVVGDFVILSSGEMIAADGFLVSGSLTCDQSAMTGESKEVKKRCREAGDSRDCSPNSPFCCIGGCTVLTGEGIMEVFATGEKSFLGGISKEIQVDTRESPLKIRLTKLARQISAVGYVAAILVALVYLLNVFLFDSTFDLEIIKYKLSDFSYLFFHLLHALTLALTVVVVAVPEGLPMMIAVVLSANIKKMVRDNVLVRKPVGIEAAGSMNILFTDKTGTLTEGILSVDKIYLGDMKESSSLKEFNRALYDTYVLSAFGNTTSAMGYSSGVRKAVGGNSTDRAILESATKRGVAPPSFTVLKKLPFDSNKKFSAALIESGGKKRLFVKGAPERLIPYLHFYIDGEGKRKIVSRENIAALCRELTTQGKRVLIVAESDTLYVDSGFEAGQFDSLTLICTVTLEDKIRNEAKRSVEKLLGAGIRVVMITGDNKETAESIAKKCGILRDKNDIALSHDELEKLSDMQLKELLPSLSVVARALPQDKSRLVRISQELDLVVGMTGDGVNDAPALKMADVGFSMGSGTQVAKDAGDIIILDNNLASIVKSVLYGRNIFKSIRKFISLQLMMNLCAVGVSMIGPFLGFDAPVTVVQMLWINIIMDTLGGLAFAGEPALESCMEEKPKKRNEPILNAYMIYEIVFGGAFTVALCLVFLKLPQITNKFRFSIDNIYLLTAFFALFIFASVFNCFCARTDRLRLLANITKNKAFIIIMAAILFIQILFVYLGGAVLRTTPLNMNELFLTSALALLVFPADFLRKVLWRAIMGKKGY